MKTISEAHWFVQNLYDKNSRARRWFGTPLNLLMDVTGGDILVSDVTPDHVIEWEKIITTGRSRPDPTGKSKRLSHHTVDSYKRALRAFFNHLVAHKWLTTSPVSNNVSFPSVSFDEPKHLTPDQVKRLVNVAAADVRSHAIIQVFRASGVRLSGIAGLTLGDVKIERFERPEGELMPDERELISLARDAGLLHLVDEEYLWFYEGEITVVEKGQRGRKKIHKSIIDHDACLALIEYVRTRPAVETDLLWLSDKGEPVTAGAIYNVFSEVAKLAGVPASPHVMRHTFAYAMLDHGVDVKTVSQMLHHSSFKTTLEVYVKPRRDDIRRKYRQVSRASYAAVIA